MTLARIYGRKSGNGSLAVVTRGFERALGKAGVLAGVYGFDTDGSVVDESDASTDGADARHGVYTGWLGGVGKMFELGRHEHHWVMIAPNSDQLPRDLVQQLKKYQADHQVHFMAPSRWASSVVVSFLGRCLTVPHGVMPEFMPNPASAEEVRDLYKAGLFRALHFSTSDRGRKGTVELLNAWVALGARGHLKGARLLCVLDYPAKIALEEAIADGEVPGFSTVSSTVTLNARADLTPEQMARTLALSHVVIQPSRGEGFGLIPLEALCSGTPIVATCVTGHSEYLSSGSLPGVVLVPTGDMAPLDDLPGSRAWSIDPEALANSIQVSRTLWPNLHAGAQSQAHIWRSNWSWEASLESFVQRLKST